MVYLIQTGRESRISWKNCQSAAARTLLFKRNYLGGCQQFIHNKISPEQEKSHCLSAAEGKKGHRKSLKSWDRPFQQNYVCHLVTHRKYFACERVSWWWSSSSYLIWGALHFQGSRSRWLWSSLSAHSQGPFQTLSHGSKCPKHSHESRTTVPSWCTCQRSGGS